jgi:hypothetical protein
VTRPARTSPSETIGTRGPTWPLLLIPVAFVLLLTICTAVAHGAAGRTRTLHTRCLYAPARNGVAETACTVTVPARVRFGAASMLLVEVGR